MQLTPRYDGPPILELDGDPLAVVEPTVRQRRRLAAALADLDADGWAHPTRCDGWSTRDVIVHLDTTNTFWTYAIGCGLRGEPSRLLASFDPVASPAAMVAADTTSDAEVLARFTTSTEAFVERLGSLDAAQLRVLAEAPPGHLAVSALAHHALWDSWIHERDILEPLGVEQEVEPDEVAAALRYAAGLGAGFELTQGIERTGRLAVAAESPDVAFVVDVDDRVRVRSAADAPERVPDLTLEGDAVVLLEALSRRAPLDPAPAPDAAWLVSGLATVFDQT